MSADESNAQTKGPPARVVIATIFVLLALTKWFWSATHCVIEYNGGRILQCSYEVLYKEIPDND